MKKKLTGKVSIITGAARGIGAAAAQSLAEEGSHIVLVDVLSTQETRHGIEKSCPDVKVFGHQIDIKNRTEVENLMKITYEELGSVDVVVNNAGTCSRLDLEDMTDNMWYQDIETNLRGTFLMTQSAIYPYMKEQRSGKIINVSSISGIMGGPFSTKEGEKGGRSGPAYAASKGGIIALTKWVAKEVGELGINCNSVAPGPVQTDITEGINYQLNQAIKKMGNPEEIAEAVVYLASADYVTGEVLKVCGGSAIG